MLERPNYVAVMDDDVLCYRGFSANAHPGNVKYQRVKEKLQGDFETASYQDKMSIVKQLVATVHEWGGRFLERDPATGKWFEAENKRAYQKASQALRENQCSPKKRDVVQADRVESGVL